MQVWISGYAGPWTIVSVSPSTMVLRGAALTPTYNIVGDATIFTPVKLTVFGYDANFDGGVRMGGDRITVCNVANTKNPCGGPTGTDKIAGPDSPLVVYGDTSQDGVWYGGRRPTSRATSLGRSRSIRSGRFPDQKTRTTSGFSRWLIRSTSPATTSSMPADCLQTSFAMRLAAISPP